MDIGENLAAQSVYGDFLCPTSSNPDGLLPSSWLPPSFIRTKARRDEEFKYVGAKSGAYSQMIYFDFTGEVAGFWFTKISQL